MSNSEQKILPSDTPDEAATGAAEGMLGPNPFVGLRPQDILGAMQQIAVQAWRQPRLALDQGAALTRDLLEALSGNSTLAIPKGDKRFTDPAWRDNPFYRTYLQSYLAWNKALAGLVDRSELDAKCKERAAFVVSLFADALAPTNTLMGNPAALKKLVESGGASLLAGMQNMLADLENNRGMPAQVDKRAFQPGENVAVSPGAVVFRNELLELIQYEPATPNVYARPHLIVPPQINKYYIFDLSPGRSIVEYLVKSGFQVFVVSWRNPTPAQRDWDMETYVAALRDAIDAVREISNAEDINLHGACSGAMTLSALLGHLATKRERLVNAATLMVAVLESSDEPQLTLFATPEAVQAAKQYSAAKGVLEGQDMGRVFAWMRPNDLVWNYWVNNYLMGNPPPAFDILYWNNDTTRLAAKFHAQLLDIFLGDLFNKPGAVTILGTPIDLSTVDCDKYVVAGITDHITPWKGVYNTARIFGGKTDFILSSSGHIQSLINPPGNPKSKFYVNPQLPADPEQWLSNADTVSQSWWEHWREWLAVRSGEQCPAPAALGSTRNPPLAKAPGTYVTEP